MTRRRAVEEPHLTGNMAAVQPFAEALNRTLSGTN